MICFWPSGEHCMCLWVMLITFVRFLYRLSNILFVNVLQNVEICIHCVGYLKYVYTVLAIWNMYTLCWLSEICIHCVGYLKYVYTVLAIWNMYTLCWLSEICIHCVGYLKYVYTVLAIWKQKRSLVYRQCKEHMLVYDFRLPLWCKWDLQSSGTLCNIDLYS